MSSNNRISRAKKNSLADKIPTVVSIIRGCFGCPVPVTVSCPVLAGRQPKEPCYLIRQSVNPSRAFL